MNYNKKTVEAYCNHVVKVSQGTPTTYTLKGEVCTINYAIDLTAYVTSIQAGGQYRYEIIQDSPFTQDDIMFGMVFRRVWRNKVKAAPGLAGVIYHVRSYGKGGIFIGADPKEISYEKLAEEYEYATDMRAWSTTPDAKLEWRPAKKTSPHYEFSPTYDSLISSLPDEPRFDEDEDDDL